MTEIERRWKLDSTNFSLGSIVVEPKPTGIVQYYLDVKGLQHLVKVYDVNKQPTRVLRVPIEHASPWVYEPEAWAGAILAGTPGTIRVRSSLAYGKATMEDVLTIKGRGLRSRNEHEVDLPDGVGLALNGLPRLGDPVQKWRHSFWLESPRLSHPYELDIFSNRSLTGLIIVEHEFDNEEEADAFELSHIFDAYNPREVTSDDRYSNFSLAVNGLPAD